MTRKVLAMSAVMLAAATLGIDGWAETRAGATPAAHREALRTHPLSPVFGNANGDLTIVEFFDYNCGYCRRVHGKLMDLVESDGNIRLVLQEFPILGPHSRFAARAALAADRQGRYLDFHTRLMSARGRHHESRIMNLAHDAGLDVAQLRNDMDDPAITAYLDESLRARSRLGVRKVPSFLVGDRIITGSSIRRLGRAVSRARANEESLSAASVRTAHAASDTSPGAQNSPSNGQRQHRRRHLPPDVDRQ